MKIAESFVAVYIYRILQTKSANIQVHNQYGILKLLGFINNIKNKISTTKIKQMQL